jgi:hypothetical protein
VCQSRKRRNGDCRTIARRVAARLDRSDFIVTKRRPIGASSPPFPGEGPPGGANANSQIDNDEFAPLGPIVGVNAPAPSRASRAPSLFGVRPPEQLVA